MTDLSHEERIAVWDGDGLPDDEESLALLDDLQLMADEIDALYECAKRDGWIYGKVARYETDEREREVKLAMSSYFWRRAQRWKELAAATRSQSDD